MEIAQLKQKILDDSSLIFKDKLIDRNFSMSFFPRKANVITGARRCGKTSQLRLMARKIVESGTDNRKVCYLTFFDDAFIDSDVTVSQIEKAYYELYPEYYNDDEVVFIDRHPVKVILTGSSARYLSFDIATELRGRALTDHFYPLSFQEFMLFNGIDIKGKEAYSSEDEAMIKNMFTLYHERGSYPELATINDRTLRNKILSSYFDLMFSRDLIERFDIAKAGELKALMRRIIKTSSSPQSLKRLEHILASSGHNLSAPTISSYIEMMEEAAIISSVPKYGNEKIQKNNPVKYYAVDHALVKYMNEFSSMKGISEELMVFAHLQRSNLRIFYYRTKDDYEADFLLADEDLTPISLIQVTDNFKDSRDREIRGILTSLEELSMQEGYILTTEDEEEVSIKGKTIHVMPIWKYLLT